MAMTWTQHGHKVTIRGYKELFVKIGFQNGHDMNTTWPQSHHSWSQRLIREN
jgi:hypothetical protein